MEIILATSAGFCFGVKRAVDQVYKQIESGKKIYTYGHIIHNDQVVNQFEEKGVEVIKSLEELDNIRDGVVIIRSHGVGKDVFDILKKNNVECVDATCPYVRKIQKLVEKESSLGNQIVIIGDKNHPEVQGITGWSVTPPIVILNDEEANALELEADLAGKQLYIVAQTTFNHKKFQDLVEIFLKKGYDTNVANTICNATHERQTEAAIIAEQVDAMIVIGGTQSSNTRKLYEICKGICENTYYIQTLDDLHLDLPKSVRLVGITAGASTPNNIIEEVQNYVRINF